MHHNTFTSFAKVGFNRAFSHLSPMFRASLFRILLLVLAANISACSYLKEFQAAQDSFNVAAEMDNLSKFSPSSTDTGDLPVAIGGARANYALAYEHVSKVLDGNGKAKLRKDGLLGTALTIKALCEWKLKREEATVTAGEALAVLDADSIMGTRDMAVLTALPGLIKADQAYGMLDARPKKDFDLIKKSIVSARDDFAKARNSVNKGHEVQTYLISSELALLATWNVAASRIGDREGRKAERATIREEATHLLEDLENRLRFSPDKENVIGYWKDLLGLTGQP